MKNYARQYKQETRVDPDKANGLDGDGDTRRRIEDILEASRLEEEVFSEIWDCE